MVESPKSTVLKLVRTLVGIFFKETKERKKMKSVAQIAYDQV